MNSRGVDVFFLYSSAPFYFHFSFANRGKICHFFVSVNNSLFPQNSLVLMGKTFSVFLRFAAKAEKMETSNARININVDVESHES